MLKACPIPGCGGAAVASPNKENARVVECSAQDCLTWLPVGLWQALPRPSESVLEVAREIQEAVKRQPKAWGKRAFLEDWASRLFSAASGMGTPGEVWVGLTVRMKGDVPVIRDVAVGTTEKEAAANSGDSPIKVYGPLLLHGTPQVPKAEAGSVIPCSMKCEFFDTTGLALRCGKSGLMMPNLAGCPLTLPVIGAISKGECALDCRSGDPPAVKDNERKIAAFIPPTTAEGERCETCGFWFAGKRCNRGDHSSPGPKAVCSDYTPRNYKADSPPPLPLCLSCGLGFGECLCLYPSARTPAEWQERNKEDEECIEPTESELAVEQAKTIPSGDHGTQNTSDGGGSVALTPRAEVLRRAREQLERWHFKYPSHERGGIGRFAAALLEWAEDTDRRRTEARRQLGKCFVEDRDEAQLVLAVNELIGEL